MVTKIIDVDSHILEPGDLWEKNLEPRYRDKGIRLLTNDKGLEIFQINSRKSLTLAEGIASINAAVGQPQEVLKDRFFKPGTISWEEGRLMVPGSMDPRDRVKLLDEEGVDATLLYPTIGLSWEVQCEDSQLAAACCRVYNDWLTDFSKPYPGRLLPVAHIPLMDVDEAVKELRRTAKMGMKGVFFNIWPLQGKPLGSAYYDPFWAEAQDLDMPVSIHVTNGGAAPAIRQSPQYAGEDLSNWFFEVMLSTDVVYAFTTMLAGGVLERFPKLKIVLLETGCGWIAHWLDRMDEYYERLAWDTPMKLKPSEYFARQGFISMEPDEKTVVAMAQIVGAGKIMWASDYPHFEGHMNAIEGVRNTIKPLPAEAQQQILGENAIELYKLY